MTTCLNDETMKRRLFLLLITILIFTITAIFLVNSRTDAAMTDYCVVPPYVVQDVVPNIMIVLDNSGSMFNLAYFDGFNTTTNSDDNMCTSTSSPCTGFTNPGTYPSYKYYGYFNPDYWYTYSSNRFVPAAPKTGSGLAGARAKNSSEWDGSFLNWLTMRRIDVMRKVLTGGAKGTGEGSGYDRLKGEKADCDSRGIYKQITNIENYADNSYTGTRCMRVITAGGSCNGSGSGTSSFNIDSGSSCSSFGSDYNVAVRVPSPVEGLLQNVVGTKARIGLTFYNTNTSSSNQGGNVRVSVSGGSLSSTVNEINLTRPSANTPLAETLWTVTGYFAQQASIASGPGPRYNSGDYQINNNNDPYNYGTGGQPRFPLCSKSYVLYLTDGEPCADGNLPSSLHDYANGLSNYNCTGTGCPSVGSFPASTFPSCSGEGSSSYCNGVVSGCYVAGIEDIALYMHTTDLRNSPTLGVNHMTGTQNLNLYAVFAFGKGSTLLRYAAINGGFEDSNGNNIPDIQSEWDQNVDGEPDTFYEAYEGYELETAINSALSTMLKRASSGTAASVLASGEGRGANLVQAVFYPRRRFGDNIISWTGENQNLWYYIDPLFTNSNIREDTTHDWILNLQNDYIVQMYFDTTAQQTKARRYQDTDGDGDADTTQTTVTFENITSLWKAGEHLWSRDISSDPRTIYTTTNGTGLLSGNFSTANASTLTSYLQAADSTEADRIIRYVHGEDITLDANADGINDYRPRTVTIGSDTHVWKLGDIINSTPRISSWVSLNTYDQIYGDNTYKSFYQTTGSTGYTERGVVFTGANDGMLHAFNLGKLELSWEDQGSTQKARLTGTSSDFGKEKWAFIPKNVLPYLKYISDPEYCHIFSVDLTPYMFDASIGAPGSGDISGDTKTGDSNSWRTILIGGMRFGGACRTNSSSCTDCVKTPVSGNGYSSYFALDVTNQDSPQLLWEFSDENLGFATTGPAVVRIGSDKNKNGKWFVVFGSGPTGPIDTTYNQFLGKSDQNLRFFVLDLKTGSLTRTIDTGITYAFAGSMFNVTSDPDLDYQDDVIYIGYTKRTGSSPNYTWTNGGIGRLVTKEDASPANWAWSTVLDNIGPVTSSVGQLQNKSLGILWLYLGTGRYFFELGTTIDDETGQRQLFGIKEPCFTLSGFNQNCTSAVSYGGLTDVTSIGSVPSEDTANGSGFTGWYINLDASGSYTYSPDPATNFRAERMITDPLATTSGHVFFTSYKPYSDECGVGGKSFIWAIRYNTGGAPSTTLKGTSLLQVSTGSIEQVNLATAFTQAGGRKTAAIEGVPPTAQGISILSAPPPAKKVIHMRER